MPIVTVKVPEAVFDAPSLDQLASGIAAAAKLAEQIGDEPWNEALTWVTIEELKAAHIYSAGRPGLETVLPVFVRFEAPAGVLGNQGRQDAARLIHAAVEAIRPVGDTRRLMTSVIVSDVAEETWGVSGELWRLPRFARAAGYKHLQHLVSSD